MKILALNCGSSSVKYQLYDTSSGRLLAKGVKNTGWNVTVLTIKMQYLLFLNF